MAVCATKLVIKDNGERFVLVEPRGGVRVRCVGARGTVQWPTRAKGEAARGWLVDPSVRWLVPAAQRVARCEGDACERREWMREGEREAFTSRLWAVRRRGAALREREARAR